VALVVGQFGRRHRRPRRAKLLFGLGFWGSVLVIVAFNVLGVLPVAFLSTLGPKTGLAQMPLSRFSFGYYGALLPAFFNMLA